VLRKVKGTSSGVPDVFNLEKSTNTVGEASTWNRLIFDVDESTVLEEGNFNVESTLKIYHVCTDTFRRRIDVEST